MRIQCDLDLRNVTFELEGAAEAENFMNDLFSALFKKCNFESLETMASRFSIKRDLNTVKLGLINNYYYEYSLPQLIFLALGVDVQISLGGMLVEEHGKTIIQDLVLLLTLQASPTLPFQLNIEDEFFCEREKYAIFEQALLVKASYAHASAHLLQNPESCLTINHKETHSALLKKLQHFKIMAGYGPEIERSTITIQSIFRGTATRKHIQAIKQEIRTAVAVGEFSQVGKLMDELKNVDTLRLAPLEASSSVPI